MYTSIMLILPKSIVSGAVVRLNEARAHAFGSGRGSDTSKEERIP